MNDRTSEIMYSQNSIDAPINNICYTPNILTELQHNSDIYQIIYNHYTNINQSVIPPRTPTLQDEFDIPDLITSNNASSTVYENNSDIVLRRIYDTINITPVSLNIEFIQEPDEEPVQEPDEEPVSIPSILESVNYEYYKSDDDNSEEACPITGDDFKEGDEIIVLPCNHRFSPAPIIHWLSNEKISCPICRHEWLN